jgi:hypothetical protein
MKTLIPELGGFTSFPMRPGYFLRMDVFTKALIVSVAAGILFPAAGFGQAVRSNGAPVIRVKPDKALYAKVRGEA